MHAKNPIVLEAEPQYLKPHTLRGFRVTALNARESVLGHNGILWVRGEGCVKQGEEVTDLGADNNDHGAGNSTSTSTMQGKSAVHKTQPLVDVIYSYKSLISCLTIH